MKQTLFYTIHFSLLAAHCVCITLMIFYAFIFIFHNSDSLTGGSKWTVGQLNRVWSRKVVSFV